MNCLTLASEANMTKKNTFETSLNWIKLLRIATQSFAMKPTISEQSFRSVASKLSLILVNNVFEARFTSKFFPPFESANPLLVWLLRSTQRTAKKWFIRQTFKFPTGSLPCDFLRHPAGIFDFKGLKEKKPSPPENLAWLMPNASTVLLYSLKWK